MAGKATGDRRKPRKGAKNAAPAKAIRVGVIDYKDVATLRKFIGAWKDPRPSYHRSLGAGAASDRQGDQERP